ncbi:MAG: hypothetical protein O2960_22690 [Verrucomicrobia bacterium]|nr:hypothetical protein [Verrucomicrobiota bacterium]
MNHIHLLLALAILAFAGPARGAVTFQPSDAGSLKFAAAEIELAAKDARQPVPNVTLSVSTGPAQSYRIERDGAEIRIIGGDATGAMYGGLDVAEAIRLGTLNRLKPGEHKPRMEHRGIKFNIPLDLRTPSYSDSADAAQANIPEMWEREFWTAFLDDLARHRYNVLSLWSLHPFPSLVKVPEFPEVALDDVWRTRAKLDDTFSFWGSDMVRPEMLADHEVVKQISIGEKIEFWRWVMQYAKDRGIDVYVFTWNAFTFGAEGKHGITNKLENDTTKRYFRASVREMVKAYPLLAGFGITAGEGMPHNMDPKEKEKWLWDTYGEGVRDALKEQPGRDVCAGFYMGPDGYTWGRSFLERDHPAGQPRPLVIEKQWYSFLLWGRHRPEVVSRGLALKPALEGLLQRPALRGEHHHARLGEPVRARMAPARDRGQTDGRHHAVADCRQPAGLRLGGATTRHRPAQAVRSEVHGLRRRTRRHAG